jgi:hypothetical protein
LYSPYSGITIDSAGCFRGIAQNDAKVTINIVNGDKADFSYGASYTGANYGSASNQSVILGKAPFNNLNNGGQYTFRVWNGVNTCYKDTTLNIPNRLCLPCPMADTLCTGDTLMIVAQTGLTNIVWYKDGGVIAGATGNTYDATSVGQYWYEGKDINGCIIRLWCPIILVYKNCSPCGTPNCGAATTTIKRKI